ncbi:thiamine-monophosphate kinase [Dehalogenimonas lykanthroporepellens BL-DC-9]|nr:thiamine-monophosphate kinase [Dehalogenimonas lykanthroporepellens BL-DC-9]
MLTGDTDEFQLIDALAAEIRRLTTDDERVEVGIGDDTAVVRVEAGLHLYTVDALVEGSHFERRYLDLEGLGWKALAVNLSDIAAMGGQPRHALVSLVVPAGLAADDIVRIYRGLSALASLTATSIIGGNLSRGSELALHVTLIGQANREDRVMVRSSARPGEVICVTGTLGGAATGLKCLEGRVTAGSESVGVLTEAFWRPQPRLETGQKLVDAGIRCAIDISDGLLSDLGHIVKASGVGARLKASRIPVNPTAVTVLGHEPALQVALSGGEDYELLFTAPVAVADRLRRDSAVPITVIGEITAQPGKIELLDEHGRSVSFRETGWRHL